MSRMIDMTPTWAGILPAYLAVLEDGTEEGKSIAREELGRMAQAADEHNAAVKAEAAAAPYYSREVKPPKTKAEGLQNAVQLIINQLEAGNTREGLLQAVNLLDDLSGKADPYGIQKERA